MSALTLIKIFRPIFPSYRLQKHLSNCALYEVLDRRLHPWLPPLRKRHVLGFERLPAHTSAQILIYPTLKG